MNNTQEIYQNMTKGEWYEDEHAAIRSKYHDGKVLNDSHVALVTTKADRELVLLLKRETVDKGINPESVGEFSNLLKSVVQYYTDSNFRAEQDIKDCNDMADYMPDVLVPLIEEALTAAKL